MATTISDKQGRTHLAPESENLRNSGTRKLVARPGEPLHTTSWFDGASSDERDSVNHLMEPVIKNETHQYDGVNPSGSFATESNPKPEVVEGDPTEATPQQSRRPL
jgi:hypothetical protein